ncbi:MAG: hypothetical protein LUC91_06555 [Prevotella sp.]|nr:hypothetical protein [Prevotella sp.]
MKNFVRLMILPLVGASVVLPFCSCSDDDDVDIQETKEEVYVGQVSNAYIQGKYELSCSLASAEEVDCVCMVTAVVDSLDSDVCEWGICSLTGDEIDALYPAGSLAELVLDTISMEFTLPVSAFEFGEDGAVGRANYPIGIYHKHDSGNGKYYYTCTEMEDIGITFYYAERGALVQLYNATNGDLWNDNTNWCSSEPLGNWYGVTLDESNQVKSISLGSNNLVGNNVNINLGNFVNLTDFNIDDNAIRNLTITGNEHTESLSLSGGISGSIRFNNFSVVSISDNDSLTSLRGECDSLAVSNCDFGENGTPFSGVSTPSAYIYNCQMYSCGLSTDYLIFESSTASNTWYNNTRIKLSIINSYCSTICSGDFNNDTVIYLENATLWRSNWDDDSLVTLSCTITGSEWYSLFEN